MATIEEAKTAIIATAQRMARSIAYSRDHMTGAALETAASIFTTSNLWTLCILFAGWVIGTVVSGPIGIAANALLVAWGLYSSYEILTELFKNGKEWAVLCYEAKTDADLRVAGAIFAKLFVSGLADILQVVILHRTFRTLRSKITNKIPPPAEVEGLKKGEAKADKPKTDEAKADKPKAESKAEKAKDEAAMDKALTERSKEASDAAKDGLKDAVVDAAAAVAPSHSGSGSLLPALALVGGVLAVGGTVALVASRSSR